MFYLRKWKYKIFWYVTGLSAPRYYQKQQNIVGINNCSERQKLNNRPYLRSLIIMEEDYNCTSCGITLVGIRNTVFPCPDCGEENIGRCEKCRDQSEEYECPECGFRGP